MIEVYSFPDQDISMQVNSIPECKGVIVCGGSQQVPHHYFWNKCSFIFPLYFPGDENVLTMRPLKE